MPQPPGENRICEITGTDYNYQGMEWIGARGLKAGLKAVGIGQSGLGNGAGLNQRSATSENEKTQHSAGAGATGSRCGLRYACVYACIVRLDKTTSCCPVAQAHSVSDDQLLGCCDPSCRLAMRWSTSPSASSSCRGCVTVMCSGSVPFHRSCP